MSEPLSVEQLESAWKILAEGIEAAGRENESKFLAKLALMLVTRENFDELASLVRTAARDL